MLSYEEHTIGSKNPLKRWLHRERFVASLRLLELEQCQRFLDYGCGDGELSRQISNQYPAMDIVAHDPAEDLFQQACKKLSDCGNVAVLHTYSRNLGKFDRIACLETLEHLPPRELHEALSNIECALNDNGFCLFTFPIEHGLISLCKNIYRMLTGRDKYASVGRTLFALFGLRVPREHEERLDACNYIFSHIGFNCRDMIKTINGSFLIRRCHVLPRGSMAFGLGNSVAVIAGKKHPVDVTPSV